MRVLPLFRDAREDVRLEQWAPGTAIEVDPDGGLEVLVLKGGFSEGGETYGAQSWPTDSCRIWVKEGHLRHVQAVQPTA